MREEEEEVCRDSRVGIWMRSAGYFSTGNGLESLLTLFPLPPFHLPHTSHPTMSLVRKGSLWTLFMLTGLAIAHGGHENVPEGSAVSDDPIVRVVSGAWCYPR